MYATGINSFADLMDFNNEYDMPQFPCEQNEDSISAHADCGKLELFTDEAKAQPLWFADSKGHLTDDDIKALFFYFIFHFFLFVFVYVTLYISLYTIYIHRERERERTDHTHTHTHT
jgi:hypothetical protein